ncbi:hypothetical protein ACMBCM_07305, partial [Spiroplasma sp. K1]
MSQILFEFKLVGLTRPTYLKALFNITTFRINIYIYIYIYIVKNNKTTVFWKNTIVLFLYFSSHLFSIFFGHLLCLE